MATMLLATPTLSDAAAIVTVGSEATDMPASNLQTMQPSEVWRVTDTGNAYVTIDFGSATTFNVIFLGHTNADTNTTWRIRGGDTEAEVNGTADEDTGSIDLWPGSADLSDWPTTPAFKYLSSAWTERWVRIDITNISTSYFEAGRLFIANAWQPATNMLYNTQFPSWHEDVQRVYSHGGGVYPAIRSRYLRTSFTVRSTQADILGNAHELGITQGVSEDVLFVFDPAETVYTAHGIVHGIVDQPVSVFVPNRDIWEVTYNIRGLV